jgi:hypothetical protein
LRVKVYQPTASIMFTYLQTEVNGHPASLGVTCGQHVESPAVVCFLDHNYYYKLVAAQIPHDAELTPIPYTGQNSSCILECKEAVAKF